MVVSASLATGSLATAPATAGSEAAGPASAATGSDAGVSPVGGGGVTAIVTVVTGSAEDVESRGPSVPGGAAAWVPPNATSATATETATALASLCVILPPPFG